MKANEQSKSNKPAFNCKFRKPEWYILNLIDKLAFADDSFDEYYQGGYFKSACLIDAYRNDIIKELCDGEIK